MAIARHLQLLPLRVAALALALPLLLAACDEIGLGEPEPTPEEQAVHDWTAELLDKFVAGRADEAVGQILLRFRAEQGEDSPVVIAVEDNREAFKKLATRGDLFGWEVLVDERISPSLWKRYFILRYRRDVVVFQTWFYRPDREWLLYHIDYKVSGAQGVESHM